MHDLIDGVIDRDISYYFSRRNETTIDSEKTKTLYNKYKNIINKCFTSGTIKDFCLANNISNHDFRQEVLYLFSNNNSRFDYQNDNFVFIITWLLNLPYL